MKKIATLIVFIGIFMFFPKPVLAATCEGTFQDFRQTGIGKYPIDPNRKTITVTITGVPNDREYYLYSPQLGSHYKGTFEGSNLVFTIDSQTLSSDNVNISVGFGYNSNSNGFAYKELCSIAQPLEIDKCSYSCDVSKVVFSQNGKSNLACYDGNSPVSIAATNITSCGQPYDGKVNVKIKGTSTFFQYFYDMKGGVLSLTQMQTFTPGENPTIVIENSWSGVNMCEKTLRSIQLQCDPKDQEENSGGSTSISKFDLCSSLNNDSEKYKECDDCYQVKGGVWTALGCIRFEPKAFIEDFLKIALGIAGGIALLLMIYGSFLISTSAGDPKKSEEGKDIITGTIAGLLFIIFSVFLLKLIGVDILTIPGL